MFCSCDGILGLSGSKTIKYEVTGSASYVNITLSNSGGNTEQISKARVPWSRSFSVSIEKDSYYFAYISAQNDGGSGSVTTTIYVDGKKFKSATSSGAYVIASAYGSVD
jgi:hypothetical protein